MDLLPYTLDQWAVDLFQHIATLPGSCAQWISFTTLPYRWEAVSSGSPSIHSHSGEQWAVGLLLYTATVLWSSGQWDSFFTLPRC